MSILKHIYCLNLSIYIVVGFFSFVLDVTITSIGIINGFIVESNPVLAWILRERGLVFMFNYKMLVNFLSVFVFVLACSLLDRRRSMLYHRIFLIACLLPLVVYIPQINILIF